MSTQIMGGLETRVIGDLSRGGPVVILCHGFGAPGTDLVPLAEFVDAPPETAYVFPAAPLTLPPAFGAGRAWWNLDMEAIEQTMQTGDASRFDMVPDGMPEARAKLEALVSQLQKAHGISDQQLILGGFSQGAMIATDVALRREGKLAGLITWSNTLVAADEWLPMMAKSKGLRVVMTHGESDPLLPFERAVTLRDHMQKAGLIVDWVKFAGAHEIPPDALDKASDLIRRVARALKK